MFDPNKVTRLYSRPNDHDSGVTVYPDGTDRGTYIAGADFDALAAEMADLRRSIETLAAGLNERLDRAKMIGDELSGRPESAAYAAGQEAAYRDAVNLVRALGRPA